MEISDQHPSVFLSYASPDRDRVLQFYDHLTSNGFDVWMDAKRLRAGQNWDFEVRKALDAAAVIVVFISKNSVDRRGYVQREIKIALRKLEEKLPDDIYLIPVRLDSDAFIPPQIADLQVVTGEDDSCKNEVTEAVRLSIREQGVQIERSQESSQISWSAHRYSDEWDGLPGYSVLFDWFTLRSPIYSRIIDISEIVKGKLLESGSEWRKVKFDQDPAFHNFGEERSRRQNSWEATCSNPTIAGRVLSFQYAIWWYGAKAAHPNFGFETFNFLLDPPALLSLVDIFVDAEKAFAVIQKEIRLSMVGPSGEADPEYPLDVEWMERGTSSWEDISAYTFGDKAINFYFGAYAVAPYAWGPQFASVAYDKLAELIKPEFRSALDIYYLAPLSTS